MAVATAALVLLALLVFWVAGGIALRVAGVLLALIALLSLAVTPTPGGAAAFVLGAAMWLAGHWHYAFRHHRYKSPLARRAFLQILPARLDPTRNWGIRVIGEPSDRLHGPRR